MQFLTVFYLCFLDNYSHVKREFYNFMQPYQGEEMSPQLFVADGKATIKARGSVDLYNSFLISSCVDRAREDPGVTEKVIDFDLSEVNFMDASGLRYILQAQQRLKDSGTDFLLALLNPQTTVSRLFEISGLVSVGPLDESESTNAG